MNEKVFSTLKWLPRYLLKRVHDSVFVSDLNVKHIYFCICDHFEPYWGNASDIVAKKRIARWINEYPKIAQRFVDSDGGCLKYSFFYPEEEYQREDIDMLAEMCLAGFGEVEIHLHHSDDNPDNLRETLNSFKYKLSEHHGLLSEDLNTGSVSYGFIHGNWALNNCHPEKKYCGVDNEIPILIETGCYADFTFPSAPSSTQPSKINSIYYATDKPGCSNSHDWGIDSSVGARNDGLLMVQGPLCLDFNNRKFGVLPRIENGGVLASSKISLNRVKLWIKQGIHVDGAREHIFIKIYTHGTQESVMRQLFDEKGFERIFEYLVSVSDNYGASLHYTSAREMVNVIKSIESGGCFHGQSTRNFQYVLRS